MPMAVFGVVSVFLGFPLFAGIITFTNRDAWMGFIQSEPNFSTNFNQIEVDASFAEAPLVFNAYNFNMATGRTEAFPMFKASVLGGPSPSNGNLVDAPPFLPQASESIFDTTHVVLYGDANTTPVWQFLRPVTAFGADYQAIAGLANIVVSLSDGSTVTLPGPSANGFFGIASDSPGALFNSCNFQYASGTPGSASFALAFDNVEGISTPEPSSLILIILPVALTMAGCLGSWLLRSREPFAAAGTGAESED
jgi:hypothetical protein